MAFQYFGDVSAGDLRHRIRIEAKLPVLDSGGDPQQDPDTGEVLSSWQLVAEVWAKIVPLSAMKRLAAEQLQSNVISVIYIRHRADVDATMRIVHNGWIYDITGMIPDPDSGQEWLQLPVSRGMNAG